MATRLIVGLGNPGSRYAATRHNAGHRFVRGLASRFNIAFEGATKFKASIGRGRVAGADLRLLLPSTYMNRSGEAVAPFARYYRIEPEEILLAHDEVAFPPGVLRLKAGGGTNGHKGIESVIAAPPGAWSTSTSSFLPSRATSSGSIAVTTSASPEMSAAARVIGSRMEVKRMHSAFGSPGCQ